MVPFMKKKFKNNVDYVIINIFWFKDFFKGFVIVASWTFVIKNLSNDEWTKGKNMNLNLCKCTGLNIKFFKYKGLHGH